MAIQRNIETRPFNTPIHSTEVTWNLYKTIRKDNMIHEQLFALFNHFGMPARYINHRQTSSSKRIE